MIIRRKMPRLLNRRRPIGMTGLRSLTQSSAHVRRMVVSQLPASISNSSSSESASSQLPAYSPDNAALAPPSAGPESRMPADLQAVFDMHKALGRVETPKKSLRERIAEQRASEPQSAPPPSARIQKRPDNVRYEPDSRVQRSAIPSSIESDIEPLPEMPPPKSNRVRSFVEYVNVSSGVPESSETSDDSETESSSSDDTDWISGDDLPDAMPGSYTVDTGTPESTSQMSGSIQRYVDDHPTLVDVPFETQSSSDGHSETVQRSFDPIKTSDEELLPPSHDTSQADDSDNLYAETSVDNGGVDSPAIQRSFAPMDVDDEELLPPSHDTSQADDSDHSYAETSIDNGGLENSPAIQRSFAPMDVDDEELLPPSHDTSQADDSDHSYAETSIDNGGLENSPAIQRSFAPMDVDDEELLPPSHDTSQADDGDHSYVETSVDNGGLENSPAIQRSFAPMDVDDEELLPPSRQDAPQSDDGDHSYVETSVDNGGLENSPAIQRSFAPMDVNDETLLPPASQSDNEQDGFIDSSNSFVESSTGNLPIQRKSASPATNDETLLPPSYPNISQSQTPNMGGQEIRQKSPPIQRSFEPVEADVEELLPPASYSGDTQTKSTSSTDQSFDGDNWEDGFSQTTDTEVFGQNNAASSAIQREYSPVEVNDDNLLPSSYQQSDQPRSGVVNAESPMTVSRSNSPIVQRFPESDAGYSEDYGDYEDTPSSNLPLQSLDLGQALMDAGLAKQRPEAQPAPQDSFPVLMPPIGRAHHSASSTPVQRTSHLQPVQRTEAPASSNSSSQSTEASLLEALGMPKDTAVQRSGAQMPKISESSSEQSSSAVQRKVEVGGVDSNVATPESSEDNANASPDVDEMAKQVYRILQRRFRVERSRSKGR